MTKLTIVPSAEPSDLEVLNNERKRIPKPDGMLQCARCGCRSSITIVNGAFIKNGRKQGGTVTVKDECMSCWKRGIYSPMIRETKPVK